MKLLLHLCVLSNERIVRYGVILYLLIRFCINVYLPETNMKQELYLKRFKEIVAEMVTLTTNKNHDYAGKQAEDAFCNFKLIESLGVTTTEA